MANRVVMPKAGMAMETGIIIKWLKAKGDTVQKGEPLLEIETDKTTMEVESGYSGVLLKILAKEGEEIPVVQTIAYIGEQGEQVPEEEPESQPKEAPPSQKEEDKPQEPAAKSAELSGWSGKHAATPAARRIAYEKGIELSAVAPSGSFGQIKAEDVLLQTAVKATPLAKAIADDIDIKLAEIRGSGHDGKVTKEDVMHFVTQAQMRADGEDELVPHSAMRKVIAQRMLQSHLEIPPVTQNSLADVTELMALREKINAGTADLRVTLNDFVLMAVARALREHPYINASYTDQGMLIKKRINVGMAVALYDGLIVPVIRDTNKLSLKQIAQAAKSLASKAKDGKLMPDEYTGGTFTVSNLGMMGVTAFTPIINQPESAILGVCAIRQCLEMDDKGEIHKRLKMDLCLTYDHRSIDGAQAALFSNTVIKLLENPLLLLV